MKYTFIRSAATLVLLSSFHIFDYVARAQSKADEAAVRNIPQTFAAA